MSDLISRQAAINTLKMDYTIIPYAKAREYVKATLDEIWDRLDKLPSAQPEIIRCKDCKHRDVENGFCEGRGWPMQLVPDDGFCDKGERSEG